MAVRSIITTGPSGLQSSRAVRVYIHTNAAVQRAELENPPRRGMVCK